MKQYKVKYARFWPTVLSQLDVICACLQIKMSSVSECQFVTAACRRIRVRQPCIRQCREERIRQTDKGGILPGDLYSPKIITTVAMKSFITFNHDV